MKRFASEHDIELAASFGYSDSASDIPMLELVGHPIAVNPDAELARVAAERGWRVMRFEKLGRTIAAVAAVIVAALVGGAGSAIARRRSRVELVEGQLA